MVNKVIKMLKYLDAGDQVRNQLLRNHKRIGPLPLTVMTAIGIVMWKELDK